MRAITPKSCLVFLLVALTGGTCWAKKHHHLAHDQELTITEVSPADVTLDAGKDVQETYKITGTSKLTLNGIAVQPDALRAGMVAKVSLAADDETVLALDAKDAPRTTKKFHRVPEATVVNVR